MEEHCSVNSRGKIMNSSTNQITNMPFSDADDLSPTRLDVSKENRPGFSEVYGFLGWITVLVATGSLVIWAYVPEYWLHSVGIYYYPSRYYALPLPTYVMVTIILAIGVYVGLNFMATPPPNSLKSMFDELSKELLDDNEFEQVIEPISDIGINKVTEVLNDLK